MPKNVTISVPDDLAKKMEAIPEVNWSEVCRQAIAKYIDERGSKEKGELLEGLEEYLKTKLPKSEEKESIRKAEIERFTKKWGKPDPDPFTHYTEFEPPYVEMQKRREIKAGDRPVARLWISNSRELAKRVIELDEKGWGKYKKELYPEDIQNIADYFKSKGFIVAEDSFVMDHVMMYVLDTYGSQGREQARDLLSRGNQYFGLFATDKEDYVFIAYREVKPK